MPMADVGAAFQLHDTSPVDVPGLGTVPTNVARVCALTWMCAAAPLGPNSHPNDEGYQVVSNAIAAGSDAGHVALSASTRSRPSRCGRRPATTTRSAGEPTGAFACGVRAAHATARASVR